ncbi:MAG: RNA polymerase sigma factor [Nannocystaceae bacterium]
MSEASSPALRVSPPARAAAPARVGDDLVAQARDGDMRAWAELYQRHFDRVYRRLAYFVGAASIAEDLTQETFARAVVGLRAFDGRAAFSTWLCGIAGNVARNYLRDREAQRRAEQRLADTLAITHAGEDGDRTQLRRARTAALYEVLEGMPEHLREAFLLREVEGLTAAEAAEAAGVSTNNMTVRVWRARAKIRAELGRRGWLTREEAER